MIFEVDNIFTYTRNASESEQAYLYNCLMYEVPSANIIERQLQKKYGKPDYRFDGIKSFYDRRYKRFLTGFLGKVCQGFIANNQPYEVWDRRTKPPQCPTSKDFELKGITLPKSALTAIL